MSISFNGVMLNKNLFFLLVIKNENACNNRLLLSLSFVKFKKSDISYNFPVIIIRNNKYFIIVTFFCCDEHHNLFLNQFIMYLN